MTEVFRLADSYVDELAVLDPFTATDLGIPGHDDEVTDYSPDGVESRADLARRRLAFRASGRPPFRGDSLRANLRRG